ncbi:MAG: arylesterase [Pseudomonadota bacterium]
MVAGTAMAEKPPKIVVLGDSLVAAYQLPQEDGYPAQLQKALDAEGVQAEIIGAGVSGDTTSGGLARLAWSVPDGTDAVLLELGANDALRGLPPETTRKNLVSMIEQLQSRNIKVALFGMLAPPNMGADYEAQFNPIYGELSEKYDLPLYPFFLDGVLTKPEFLLPDGIHPNGAGVKIMVEKTLPLVERLVESLRPTP